MREERGKKVQVCWGEECPGESRERGKVSECSIERAKLGPNPEGFYLEVSGKISIELSSAFPVCLLRLVVSTDCSAPGQEVNAVGPETAMVSPHLVLLLF